MGQEREGKRASKAVDRRQPVSRGGRPLKFGRPSQLVALTLPQDVLQLLQTIHHDPAWAVVQLAESLFRRDVQRPSKPPIAIAELIHLPGKRGLIVVRPKLFASLPGVSTIPLADGRAFLAFDQAAGLADLEVAIHDKLELTPASGAARGRLTEILEAVRGWRRDRNLVFRTKSIIVVEFQHIVDTATAVAGHRADSDAHDRGKASSSSKAPTRDRSK
jgi:hypothetical protein